MSEKIVQLNEEIIKGQIKELVRGSVEETLNGLLEAEAEKLTQAAKYERSEERQGYRSGHYSRNLTTTSGDVTLNVPRLKGISFETAIIERYRRRESSVEEALIEMYLAGVSVRRVEDITEALWGSKVSPSTISELNKKAYVHIEDWRNRPLQGGRYPYVYVDGMDTYMNSVGFTIGKYDSYYGKTTYYIEFDAVVGGGDTIYYMEPTELTISGNTATAYYEEDGWNNRGSISLEFVEGTMYLSTQGEYNGEESSSAAALQIDHCSCSKASN